MSGMPRAGWNLPPGVSDRDIADQAEDEPPIECPRCVTPIVCNRDGRCIASGRLATAQTAEFAQRFPSLAQKDLP